MIKNFNKYKIFEGIGNSELIGDYFDKYKTDERCPLCVEIDGHNQENHECPICYGSGLRSDVEKIAEELNLKLNNKCIIGKYGGKHIYVNDDDFGVGTFSLRGDEYKDIPYDQLIFGDDEDCENIYYGDEIYYEDEPEPDPDVERDYINNNDTEEESEDDRIKEFERRYDKSDIFDKSKNEKNEYIYIIDLYEKYKKGECPLLKTEHHNRKFGECQVCNGTGIISNINNVVKELNEKLKDKTFSVEELKYKKDNFKGDDNDYVIIPEASDISGFFNVHDTNKYVHIKYNSIELLIFDGEQTSIMTTDRIKIIKEPKEIKTLKYVKTSDWWFANNKNK